MSMEEQLTLEDHQFDYDHGSDTPTTTSTTTTFSQPNVTLMGTHTQRKKGHRRVRIKEKVQLFCLSMIILLAGFIAGFYIGVRDINNNRDNFNSSAASEKNYPSQNFAYEEITDSSAGSQQNVFLSTSSQEISDTPSSIVPLPPSDINADNIRDILKRMSQKVNGARTSEGKSMAMGIRDLWRSYGLSVRVEQHKTLLTKATEFSYAEVLGKNGSAVFRTSEFDDHLNPRPMMAFSPPADLHGTLIYAHYGRVQDLDFLNASRVRLDRSVALIRFGGPHPSKVAEIAAMYGIGAILFYPDPQDYGPQLPLNSVRFSSLLTLGEIHEYQKHKSKFIIPAHTISPGDAQELLRYIRQGNWMKRAPPNWQGGLKTPYFLGPTTTVQTSSKFGQTTSAVQVRLRIFNEPQIREIYNVVAAIPGAWESDRYIVVGCSHDAWNSGAGDPGIGIALISEMARSFSNAVQKGWKPRRSILFISFDANLFASSGVSHWLQEHHFEISSRTIAYIDLSRVLRGNETLHVHSSPILNSVARKAIARVVTHADSSSVSQPNPSEEEKEVEGGWRNGSAAIYFSSLVTSDEPSFAFLNLGIPFFRISVSNSPKGYDYPLFHTSFDTAENFANSVDPELKGAKTLGKIILETIVLLADSIVLPINVEDYVMEIQKAFGNFIQQYQQELHRGNLSIAYLQAAVMRLEVIGDNFQTEMHNRTVINPEYDTLPAPSPSPKTIKSKKALLHRIINDKLMEIDRAFLSRSSDVYKHLVLGFTSNMDEIRINGTADNMSTSLDHFFPKLRESLECGRRVHELAEEQEPGIKEIKTISLSRSGSKINSFAKHRSRRIRSREKKFRTRDLDGIGTFALDTSICHDWHIVASQRIASLTRALDAASAILQSPLLPEESE